MIRVVQIIVSLFVLMSIVSGCNTVQGMGEDLQQGGQAIQKAAKENK